MHLLFRLFEQKLGLTDHLLTFLQGLFNLIGLLQHTNVVAVCELVLLLPEKLGAHVSFLIQLFRLQLHINEVCVFQQAGKLVQFLFLEHLELLMQRVKEVDNALSQLIFQVKLFALGDLLATLDQIIAALVDILEEILGGGLEQENLVVVIAMVRQITALLADQLIMQAAVSDIATPVVGAQGQLLWSRILLVRLLIFVMIGTRSACMR